MTRTHTVAEWQALAARLETAGEAAAAAALRSVLRTWGHEPGHRLELSLPERWAEAVQKVEVSR